MKSLSLSHARSLQMPCAIGWVLLLVPGGAAHAQFCPPLAQTRYVGAGCTYATIQAAIDTGNLCPGTRVVVTNTQAGNPTLYTNQAIVIQDKSLSIEGSRNACGAPPPVCDPQSGCAGGPPPRIGIAGNGTAPVFSIRGNSSVTFAHLDISGGNGGAQLDAPGGGISYVNQSASGGTLALRNVRLHHNTAIYGGGLGFYGRGSLRLDGAWVHDNSGANYGGGVMALAPFDWHIDVQIVNNPAQQTTFQANGAVYGGGIFLSGDVDLDAASLGLSMLDNSAESGGGALYVGNGVKADVAGAVMEGNHGGSGGAIAVFGDSATRLRLYGLDEAFVTRLAANTAGYGGGLYLDSFISGGNPLACVFDTEFRTNTASITGAAFGLGKGRLKVNPPDNDPDCGFNELAQGGAQHCAPGYAPCNRVSENVAEGGIANHPADDGAVIGHGNGELQLRRLRIEANTGGFLLSDGGFGRVLLEQCLVHHNAFTHELLRGNGAVVGIDSCTFADDVIAGNHVFFTDYPFTLTRSIVLEDKPVLPLVHANVHLQHALLNPPMLAGTDNTVYYDFNGPTQFVDAANGDYRLAGPAVAAVDWAPADPVGDGLDLDRQPRIVDQPANPDLNGPRDLGPYEYQPGGVVLGPLFADGFE